MKITTVFFWAVLYTIMLVGITRMMTRQILVKHFHLDNSFVRLIYGREQALLEEAKRYAGDITIDPIDWESRYPFDESGDYQGNLANTSTPSTKVEVDSVNTVRPFQGIISNYQIKIKSLEDDITNYVDKYSPFPLYMKWIRGAYELVTMGKEAAIASEGIYIARDKWLYSYSSYPVDIYDNNKEIEAIADNVEDFYDYLTAKDIGFIYASASSKPCPYDSQLVTGLPGTTRKDIFLKELEARNVPSLDLPALMPHNPGEWYKMYFQTDGHWNDRAGLWVSSTLAKYLNDNYGFEFDLGMFEPDNYTEDTRQDWFRGQTGRNISPVLWGKEPLTRYIPLYEPEYRVVHYSETGIEEKYGSFVDVFFNQQVYDQLGNYPEADIYEGTMGDYKTIENDDLYTIVNNKAPHNTDKKVLFIRDSYTAYVAPYFSTDIREVDLMYRPKFSGSIRAYIEETKPDAVIMLIYDGNIRPESEADWNNGYHFDLR